MRINVISSLFSIHTPLDTNKVTVIKRVLYALERNIAYVEMDVDDIDVCGIYNMEF